MKLSFVSYAIRKYILRSKYNQLAILLTLRQI